MRDKWWWDDPAEIESWGGEVGLELSKDEIGRLIAGQELTFQVVGASDVSSEGIMVPPVEGAPARSSAKPAQIKKTPEPDDWLNEALKKESPWKNARRALLQCRAEVSGLDRNIQNARVHAIQKLFPGDTYDPSDPRIDSVENRLVSKWRSKRDALLCLMPGLEEQSIALEEKRVASLNSRDLGLWRVCFGALPILEPEVVPEPLVVNVEKAGGSFWVSSQKHKSPVACSLKELDETIQRLADQSCFYWTMNSPDYVQKATNSLGYYEKIAKLGLLPIWVVIHEFREMPEGASVELVRWPFATYWTSRYSENTKLLIEEWLTP